MDDTGNMDLTHFAMKDNRLYAMGHPRDGYATLYMFKLDDCVITGISETDGDKGLKPLVHTISAHPNPFNSAVRISLDFGSESPEALSTLPPGACRVEIFDVNGRHVETLRPSATSGTGPSCLEKGGMEVPLLKGDLGGSLSLIHI